MKNYVKFMLITLICLSSIPTLAQNIRIKGGFNLSNMMGKDEDGKFSEDWKMKPGFHIGGIIEKDLTDLFSLEGGLLFSTRGFKIKEESGGESYKASINLNYIDIPVLAKATHELGNGMNVFGMAGPYFAFGICGKVKSVYEYQGSKEKETEKISWGNSSDDDFKRLDMGIKFGAGVERNACQFGIYYELGLVNISSYTDFDTRIKNRVLQFSFAYNIDQIFNR